MPEIVFIGDDFTGASDTLATLAERGARVRLFLDAPREGETEGLDAVGFATDLRARSPEEITGRLEALASVLVGLSPRYVHYKVCSTFDSAPQVGSIGAAVKALEAAFAPSGTVFLGGQPSLGRYCVFGTLFARAPDGVVHRIDRHPIMSRHPVTPMAEADLRMHLAAQGLADIGLLDRKRLHDAAEGAADAFEADGRTLVDALEDADIERLGGLLRSHAGGNLLIVGASGVAEALFPAAGGASWKDAAWRGPGARLVVAGSRSSATAAQIAASGSYERLALDRARLSGDEALVGRCAGLLRAGRDVMLHLQPELDYGLPSAVLSERLAEVTSAILMQYGAVALGVAGGDTSSAVVKRLGFRSLTFVERAGAGVAICRGHAPGSPLDGTILLLKGGQVGDAGLFERFAARRPD